MMRSMQTVNAYNQTMRCNYRRGIVLSGFSLAGWEGGREGGREDCFCSLSFSCHVAEIKSGSFTFPVMGLCVNIRIYIMLLHE